MTAPSSSESPGLIIAAPASGSGKTLVTLGLLSALSRRGIAVAGAKVGPDYIDPAFHTAASGRAAVTLDGWAMRGETLAAAVAAAGTAELVVCEGVMGLFDGAEVPPGQPEGSTADLAGRTGWPVVLVVDARGMAASAAAVVAGFARARSEVRVAGAIFNRVAGERHQRMILDGLAALCPEVRPLGFLPAEAALAVPSRHLGLVQAVEHPDLPGFLAAAARLVETHLDLDALIALARPAAFAPPPAAGSPLPPLGARIAIATDAAFAFAYPGVLEGWRRAGADLLPFSPLADEGPGLSCDAVYLPGGYPELHAGRLAANAGFLSGLRAAAAGGAVVFGECGGYMVLGRGLVDADGQRHAMAGLLPVETSFATRRRHLGYRRATLLAEGPLGAAGHAFRGHEFHFATALNEAGERLFGLTDAAGRELPDAGCRAGRVLGSFIHLIDRE